LAKRRVEILFQNFSDKYPRLLERDYPHVLIDLMHVWGEPEFGSMMQELLVSKRSDRGGFSADIVEELMFLHKLHDAFLQKNITLPPLSNPWLQLPPGIQTPQALVSALQRGDLVQVKLYLNAGISVNHQFDNHVGTPLSIAASHNRLALAEFLLELGANVDKRVSEGYSPLHWAAFFGHTQMADLLLRKGASIDKLDNHDCTPLMLAVSRGHSSMVYLLLMHGANQALGNRKGTPMEIANKRGAKQIVDMLRNKK
jgi:hypothetical protein